MKVLLVNGSPHEHGCTNAALTEIAQTLRGEGIGADIFWIGSKAIAGCVGCGGCRKSGGRCVFGGDKVTEFTDLLDDYDGFIFGSPVHYAAAGGALTCFMDRVFYSAGARMRSKPGAAVVSARRAGTTAALDQLNKYFYINGMPIPTSQYWPMVHGNTPEEVRKDLEGLQTLRLLAKNMAWLLKCIEAGKAAGIDPPEREQKINTNFIR